MHLIERISIWIDTASRRGVYIPIFSILSINSMKKILLWLAAIAFSLAAPIAAHAFQPESGMWVVSDELDGDPGRGFNLDVQGDTLVLSFYGYLSNGTAQWYLASGTVKDDKFTSSFSTYEGGMAFGASRHQSAHEIGSAGQVSIVFKTASTGTITLPGEAAKTITRYNFNRPTPPDAPIGSYTLAKVLIMYTDGSALDSAAPGSFSATGTLNINRSKYNVALKYTALGTTQSIGGKFTMIDLGTRFQVFIDTSPTTVQIVKRGDDLIIAMQGDDSTEIQYWERVSNTPDMLKSAPLNEDDSQTQGTPALRGLLVQPLRY
jgi:hypothetical protein